MGGVELGKLRRGIASCSSGAGREPTKGLWGQELDRRMSGFRVTGFLTGFRVIDLITG